jgi:hypothetical protein
VQGVTALTPSTTVNLNTKANTMSKFTVIIETTVTQTVEVEADCREDAIALGEAWLEQNDFLHDVDVGNGEVETEVSVDNKYLWKLVEAL